MIKTLVRLRLAALFSSLQGSARKNGKRANTMGRLILFIVLYLYLFAVFAFGSFSVSMGSAALFLTGAGDSSWMYFTLTALLAFALIFLGSVFTTKSQIYEAKDNELLLSMPIKPRDILISRILVLLVSNYFFEAVVFLPAIIVWILFTGGGGLLTWVALLLTLVLLPMFALAVSGVFAWLISLLTSKIRNKTLVTTAASLAFFGLYFYFFSNLDQYIVLFQDQSGQIMAGIRGVWPLYWIGSAIANGNALHLLFAVLIYAIPFLLFLWLISTSFLRIVTTRRGGGKRASVARPEAKRSSAFSALLRKELSRLFSSATYLLNCGITAILEVVAVAMLILKGNDLLTALLSSELALPTSVIAAAFALLLSSFGIMSYFTAPSISLEGKCFPLLCSLPVSPRTVLKAKLSLQLVIMIPINLICAVALGIFAEADLCGWLFLLFLPNLMTLWVGITGLICNLSYPVFDWQNEAQVIKQGMAVLLTMLFSMLMLLAVAALAFLSMLASVWLSLAVAILAFGIGDLLAYRYLLNGGTRKFEKLV